MLTIDIIFVILIIVILFAVISFIRIKRIRAERNKVVWDKEQAPVETAQQNKPEPCRPNCSVCPRKCTPRYADFQCPNLPKCKLCPGVRVDKNGKACKPYCPVEYPKHPKEVPDNNE